MCVLSHFHCVHLFVTPWTVAPQDPLSKGFPRQESWSGLPFPSPGHFPSPRIEPLSPMSPTLAGIFFTTEPPGSLVEFVCELYRAWGFLCEILSFWLSFFNGYGINEVFDFFFESNLIKLYFSKNLLILYDYCKKRIF